ncbi:hypothetical protein NBRC10512_003526 [Rhodotorula toruloides]|uniref:RHTO0S02e03422g1_1 n=2 Tax=Rhodotorula toruloides TaxID=5286 RepID=A0A061AG78_RHOTO|nr:uncharacterized protein RHTO_01218 [Rhodotorula toruloides NP11]EMS22003.1 hypothetical protein RHTO_01218 [Rhodotorula toruloides NP11]CDR36530.1 RHTO0S02e03422g1_1 [Rhodotorula toruloides]
MPPRRKTAKMTTSKKRSRAAAKETRPPPTLGSLSAETLLRIAKFLAGDPLDLFHLMLTCKTCLAPARRALPADRSLLKKPSLVIESDDEDEEDDQNEDEDEEEEEEVNSETEAYERRWSGRQPRWRIRPVEHKEEDEVDPDQAWWDEYEANTSLEQQKADEEDAKRLIAEWMSK